MLCSIKNPAMRRYMVRFIVTMPIYVLLLFFAAWMFHHYHPSGALAYLLAVLPALPIIGVIIIAGLYLAEEKDEFVRNYQIQSMVWAIGAILVVTTVWGSLEDFAHVRHLDLFMLYPLYCFFVGISSVLVKLRYR
jgi:hypothetical protein